MPSIALISDLHLTPHSPQDALFKIFIAEKAASYSKIYILGDFFQVWMGDDAADAYALEIASELKKLCRKVKIYFLAGNRDFLLGSQFCQVAGLIQLPEPSILTTATENIVLVHGDHLCTDDKMYQLYRKIVRSRIGQKLFLALPQSLRRIILRMIQKQSKKQNKIKPKNYLDVNQEAVDALMRAHHVRTVIHGHTHVAKQVDHNEGSRFVLSEWTEKAQYLEINEDGAIHWAHISLKR